jgi:hypothetical protein
MAGTENKAHIVTGDNAMDRVSRGMQDIARTIDEMIVDVAGERVHFSLFVWTEPRCSYISTAARAEVITVLEGMIERRKKGMPDLPAHSIQ